VLSLVVTPVVCFLLTRERASNSPEGVAE